MAFIADPINLSSLAFWRRPDRLDALAALRAEHPVSWHEFTEPPERGMKGFWAVLRHADVVTVSTDSKTFINGESTNFGDQPRETARDEGWFLNMDGEEHFRLRHVVAKAFSPANVQRLRQTAQRHAVELVAAVKDKGTCDFAREVAQPFPIHVICDFLGVPRADRAKLHELTVIALAGDAAGPQHFDRIPRAFEELNAYGATLAREHRTHPQPDTLMHIIVNAEVDGRRLTDREAGMFFQLLVTAGMETTGTAGSHLFRVFLENPAQMHLWRADPDGIAPTGMEEIVRYVSPIMHMRRTAAVDTSIGGQRIARGDKVVMWYLAANRDPSVFAKPDDFDVRRTPNRHVGFGGGGRHTCLGAHLARLELPILVKEVLEQLRDIEPAAPAVTIPSRFVNAISSVPIRFRAA